MRGDGMSIKEIIPGKKYLLRWRNENRESRQMYFTGTLVEAQQYKLSQLSINNKIEQNEYYFDDLIKHYLVWVKRLKSWEYRTHTVKMLSKEFSGKRLTDLTTMAIEQYQSKLLTYNKPGTVNLKIVVLKHMVKMAKKWKMVDREIVSEVRDVELLKLDNARLRYLSEEEVERLLDVCLKMRSRQLYNLVQFALHTGMRKMEIVNLTWDCIDLKNKLILLSAKMTKSKKAREIPINDTLMEVITSMNKVRRIDGRLFTSDHRFAFYHALELAGINDFVFHDLRHTFASRLMMKGCDLPSLQELLGHSQITMTMRYSHLAPGKKMEAIRLLDVINDKKENECVTCVS